MKPFDLSRLKNRVNKALKISDGFHDPKTWIDSGNYAVNKIISGSFFKGFPLGKVCVIAGESGSGKSYLASGNLCRNAQKQGIVPIVLDSEYALDRSWMTALGVDTEQLIRWPVNLVDECAAIVQEFMDMYIAEELPKPYEERTKFLFIADSLGMLSTPTEVDQFNKGEMKGDMGRKAKQLKALVTQCLKLFGPHDIGMVATNHVYKSQDQFNPDDVISGGSGFIFASSIILTVNKLKLKEDEEGNKITNVRGIRSKIKCVKSRYAKPFEEVEVQIPYDTGMSPFSGLFEMFEKDGTFKREGNFYLYTDADGVVHKMFKKAWKKNHELLMKVMQEVEAKMEDVGDGIVLDVDDGLDEDDDEE